MNSLGGRPGSSVAVIPASAAPVLTHQRWAGGSFSSPVTLRRPTTYSFVPSGDAASCIRVVTALAVAVAGTDSTFGSVTGWNVSVAGVIGVRAPPVNSATYR